MYHPTKITLTEKTGFDRETSKMLFDVSQKTGENPREAATRLLKQALIAEIGEDNVE